MSDRTPDGQHFVYVAYAGFDPVGLYVTSLDRAKRVRLMEAAANVQYAAGGR